MPLRFIISLITTLFALLASGQGYNQPEFHKLETEKLGVNNAAYQVWDNYGKMWMVTDLGLMVYNGYRTELILSNPQNVNTPVSDKIRSLWKITDDEFWITYTDNFALTRFNPIKGNYVHYFPDTLNPEKSTPNTSVAKIVFETDSVRWLLSWGEGLYKLNIYTENCKRYYNESGKIDVGKIPDNHIKDMIRISDDKYLVGFFHEKNNAATPHYFVPSTGEFFPLDLEPYFLKINDDRMIHNINTALTIINFIHVDVDQNFWIGTYVGLIFIDRAKQTIERISIPGTDLNIQNLENLRACLVDENGFLWSTTPNQGIMVINTSTKQAYYIAQDVKHFKGISDNRTSTIAKDPNGNIWVATQAGTFNIYIPIVQKFHIHPWSQMELDFSFRSFQQIPVNQIFVNQNNRVLISDAGGITEYDTKNKRVVAKCKPKEVDNSVENILFNPINQFRYKDGKIYFVMTPRKKGIHYLSRINLPNDKIEILNDKFSQMGILFRHADNDAPLVFYSNQKGVSFIEYNTEKNEIEILFQLDSTIKISGQFSILLNSGNWLLPTTENKLVVVNPIAKSFQVYQPNSKEFYFPDSTLNCAGKDKDGNVWIGTQTGLYLFEEEKNSITKQNENIGLLESDKVNAIIQDKNGVLWVALAKELLRYDTESHENFRFNSDFGLYVGSFIPAVAQQDPQGNIYIATYNGILEFNPLEIKQKSNPFNLYIDQVFLHDELLDKKRLDDKQFSFSYTDNFLTFEFHTNEVFSIKPHRFYYKLIGRDNVWQDNGTSNKIRLADLSYGDYVLEVKALNSFNQQSDILSIPIKIQTPFWATYWFIILTVIILSAFVWIYIRYREKALRKRGIELEKIITERTADVVKQKKEADRQRLEAEHQKEIVEEKQKEISDSINYAKRIQDAILPSESRIKKNLPNSFILYLPKDIVAGDFYFMEEINDHVVFAAADCTGHGVPGAMVSVVCHNALTRSVKEFGLWEPNKILDKTRELVLETFEKSESQVNDGMDISICSLNVKTKKLYFSGANNGLYLLRKDELAEYKGDKQPIGKFINSKPFSAHEIDLQSNDQLYLFTDGYADQFGGETGKPGGKKFKYSRLKTVLKDTSKLNPTEQKEKLENILNIWRGDFEQVDDVCVIGVRV